MDQRIIQAIITVIYWQIWVWSFSFDHRYPFLSRDESNVAAGLRKFYSIIIDLYLTVLYCSWYLRYITEQLVSHDFEKSWIWDFALILSIGCDIRVFCLQSSLFMVSGGCIVLLGSDFVLDFITNLSFLSYIAKSPVIWLNNLPTFCSLCFT